ncbi:MAG: hypothetical protein KF887_06925 [Paracoccaceae bacterium]|nr:MAG: hypothetical protein KF887_06925 [Paracoccaceae bacterium]
MAERPSPKGNVEQIDAQLQLLVEVWIATTAIAHPAGSLRADLINDTLRDMADALRASGGEYLANVLYSWIHRLELAGRGKSGAN